MARGKPADPAARAGIVGKIRDEGMAVAAASAAYGYSSKAIYTWLRDGVVDGNRNLTLENNRPKQELEVAYRILGRLTAETKRQKASRPGGSGTRLAIHLGWSEVKARRIRNLAGIVVPTASKKRCYRKGGKPEMPAPATVRQAGSPTECQRQGQPLAERLHGALVRQLQARSWRPEPV